jgi:CBS domain-containing protein
MRENGVRRLPVVDVDGKLAGILTLDDVLSLLAEVQYDLVAVVIGQGRRERALRP